MLTSLLSFYIITSLQQDLPTQKSEPLIKTASASLSKLNNSYQIPLKKPQYIAPVINAGASIAIDRKTGEILYEKNANTRMPIASITKLMTMLIVLEENEMSEVATVSANADTIDGSIMQLRAGEQISIEHLLYGAIIQSANDAAITLAEHNAGSVGEFVKKMNKRALELGLINTHFANPTGLDQAGGYSSAYDVAKLANYIYSNKFIQEAAKIKEMDVASVSGTYIHHLTSTNDLLDSYLHIKGLKTGQTGRAGLCLATVAENDSGNEIITVVLNSPARFTESKILVDWVFRAYNWK